MNTTPSSFDAEIDLLVIGSGAGGFVAALAGHDASLEVILAEKGDYFGGSTVLSGGSIWVPNAPEIVRHGVKATRQSVIDYLTFISKGEIAPARIEAYVDGGPEMLAFLERTSPHMVFEWRPDYPDYFPDAPGGSAVGRSVEVKPFDRRAMGELDSLMREPALRTPRGMWIGSNDLHTFLGLRRGWKGKAMFVRLLWRYLRAMVTRERIVTRGEALIGRLSLVMREAGVPIWLKSPMTSLIVEDGAVIGAVLEREGQAFRVRARKGVVLASGGFERNLEMRHRYQPIAAEMWTSGAAENTGDGIAAGSSIGAAVDLMDDAWWMPAVPWGDGRMGVLLFERQMPGQFIVNGAGKRYTNESAPYTEFVHDMIRGEATGVPHVPSWLIIDDTSWRRNMFSTHLPLPRIPFAPVPTGSKLPKNWTESGSVVLAQTLDELAEKIDVPVHTLRQTYQRFNEMARNGVDEDFGRGGNAYDNYYGDPRLPNPNMRPLDSGPYRAFKVVPGDLGTKGGLLTDEHAQVLAADTHEAIPGLYATGNVSSAVVGSGYPGPGGTIGPAMAFGYIAARHAAQSLRPQAHPPVSLSDRE